jgi:hypothetical protein
MARRRRPLLPPPPQLVWLTVLFSAVAPAVAKTDKSDGEGLPAGFFVPSLRIHWSWAWF